MKKRALSLFLAVVFCFGLLPAGALEENDDTQTGGATILSADDAVPAEDLEPQSEDDAPDGEPCDHNDYDWTYTSNGDGTHKTQCNKCGAELSANENCDLIPVAFTAETHTLKCEFCDYKKEPEAHDSNKKDEEHPAPTFDGKRHSATMCSVCGVPTGDDVQEHDYDERGTCKVCGITPAMTDDKGNLYDTNACDEAFEKAANGEVEWLELVSYAADGNENKNTLSYPLEFDHPGKPVTLKMNGIALCSSTHTAVLTVSGGTLIIEDDANISAPDEVGGNNPQSAISVTDGELIFKGNVTAKGGGGSSNAAPAIEVSGGKVTFEKNVTAYGGTYMPNNNMLQKPAVYADGGELEFKGALDLVGGLTITGDATLKPLTQGKFRVSENVKSTYRVSVVDSKNYKYVNELLANGYGLRNVVEDDSPLWFNSGFNKVVFDVTIIDHPHFYDPEKNYTCVCGAICYHSNGYVDGKCPTCGKPCSHEDTQQSSKDYNYYCNICGKQMYALNTKGTHGSADFQYAYFTNFADAMNAAEDGWTVKLLADIDNDGQRAAVIGNNKTVTLDLNGRKVTGGWITAGEYKKYITSTLKIVGRGSFIQNTISGNLSVQPGATLDLGGWTGGTITRVVPAKNSYGEGTLIVGENAGTIENLLIHSWPSDKVENTELRGGTYGQIDITMNSGISGIAFSDLLADGYAFQYIDSEKFVDYATKAEYASTGLHAISNVKVVRCTVHADDNEDNRCDYCNTDLNSAAVASVRTGGKTYFYTDLAAAIEKVNTTGGKITLLKDVTGLTETLAIDNENTFDIILDLNGKTISGAGDSGSTFLSISTWGYVTIRDRSEAQTGKIECTKPGDYAVCISMGTLTIEGGEFKGTRHAYGHEYSLGISSDAIIKGGKFSGSVNNYGRLTISGGTFTSLFNSNGGIGDLLASGYAFKNSSGAWLTENELQSTTATNVTAVEAPITRIEWSVPNSVFEYGYSYPVELQVGVWPDDSDVSYRWYKDDTLIEGDIGNTYTITDIAKLPVGDHTYRVEVTTRDGYTKSSEFTITIKQIDLNKATITQEANSGNTPEGGTRLVAVPTDSVNGLCFSSINYKFAVIYNGSTLKLGTDYTIKDNSDCAQNAGEHELTIVGTGNYTGEKTVKWTIEPYELSVEKYIPAQIDKPYDGTVEVTDSTNGISGLDGFNVDTANRRNPELIFMPQIYLKKADYELSEARFDLPDVGYRKLTFTFSLKTDNFVFTDGTKAKTITLESTHPSVAITKASNTPDNVAAALTVINDLATTYTVDLPALLPTLTAPMEYGTTAYTVESVDLANGYYTDGAKIEDDKLILPILANKVKTEDTIGTVKVKVDTNNFQPFYIIFAVAAKNQYPPTVTPTAKPDTITYGTKLADVKLTAEAVYDGKTVDGAIAWNEDTAALLNAGSHELKWKFTPTDTDKYREATGTVTLTVKRATPTGEPKYTAITASGKTLADAALAVNESWPAGTVKWVDALDTAVKANTAYKWIFTPDSANYKTIEGSITLYHVSSSGGGGGGSSVPTYKPSVAPSKDGTTTISNPNPKKGDTVKITPKPADGNEVSKVIVTDKNGKTIEVKANADGTYSFVQPDGAVTIQVVYQPKQTAQTDFADVSAAHFAYDAVKWAAEKGITGGIGDNLFAPSQSCTRAQIVTFLWRAAGSPEPKSLSGLTDVPADAYYAKAVAWAVENGITAGMGDGKFAPDAVCTRAQSVTFLARALHAKTNGKTDFTDVPADSYYASAVAWAVENGVTNGMGDNRFAPNQHCTRAQIVAFLYRAYNGK